MTEPMSPDDAHADHDYAGTAVVLDQSAEITVDVVLRGHFQPIDGRFHWYGRLAPHAGISDLVGGRKATVTLRTTSGEATATLSDPDPWDRYRIAGTGKPPFETAINPRPPASGASD
ncbi:DUF4873 domain-containing protein [Saccharopolyspora dendranthemae]|uniref:Uncharacterized protein DUF4873 n=1 Tax=Saccharopolyspora dendranthemae TaxID=1181886 RepID=A0A561U7X3_9PSEU|nr:DUF4873 domain-containing protein [Saccharopolyspora dendranthemae]TWF95469.1 uncharacterized protein DUF4873 [Saccharopolyspora dendranthemae]